MDKGAVVGDMELFQFIVEVIGAAEEDGMAGEAVVGFNFPIGVHVQLCELVSEECVGAEGEGDLIGIIEGLFLKVGHALALSVGGAHVAAEYRETGADPAVVGKEFPFLSDEVGHSVGWIDSEDGAFEADVHSEGGADGGEVEQGVEPDIGAKGVLHVGAAELTGKFPGKLNPLVVQEGKHLGLRHHGVGTRTDEAHLRLFARFRTKTDNCEYHAGDDSDKKQQKENTFQFH